MTLLWKWSLYKPAMSLGSAIRLLMNAFILHSLLKTRLQTLFASKLFTLTNLSLSSVICLTAHSAWAVLPGLAVELLHNTGIQLCWVLCSKRQKLNYAECLIRTLLNSKAMKTDSFCVLWFMGQLIKNHIILLFRCASLFVWGEHLQNEQQFEHFLQGRIK